MIRKQKFWINCEPFKVSPLFLINYSQIEYRKEVSKYVSLDDTELRDIEFADGQQATFSPTKTKGLPILRVVWLNGIKKNEPDSIGRITHEVCHLVNRIHQHKGMPFDGENNNDETFSYLVDFFVREVLKKIKI
jgi:hypothetical protein